MRLKSSSTYNKIQKESSSLRFRIHVVVVGVSISCETVFYLLIRNLSHNIHILWFNYRARLSDCVYIQPIEYLFWYIFFIILYFSLKCAFVIIMHVNETFMIIRWKQIIFFKFFKQRVFCTKEYVANYFLYRTILM